MKRIVYFSLLLLTCGFYSSCKKDMETGSGSGTPGTPVANFTTKQIEIVVPSGSSFKPAGSKVFSYLSEQTADASGKANVTFEKGSSTLAYVFDANKKLVLAGFITDSTKTISPTTTAKVLLYMGYNIPLHPDTLAVYFLNNAGKLSGAQEWEKEFETLFMANPLTLSDKSFTAPLKARIAKMVDQTAAIDIRGKPADIHVDISDIKSGLQVTDDGLSKFKVINSYRRRAHAFLYKMSYKDLSGVKHILKPGIELVTKSDADMAVSPVSAVSGFLSEIGKTIEGGGLESFNVTSGPFPMELKDDESEALYKLRIIGPGAIGKSGLTEAETSKMHRLEAETFFLDVVIPAVGTIMSLPDKPKAEVMPEVELAGKIDKFISVLKTVPDVYDNVVKGDYKTALTKLLENIAKDASGDFMNLVFGLALEKEGTAGGVRTFLKQRIEWLMAILSATDAALGASDIIRITVHVAASSWMEEWELNAKSGELRLTPDNSIVVPFQQQKMTATVKNLTQTASYEWSTSGRYGKLTDTRGHTDLGSFVSQDKDVFYTSKVSNASLGDGDNLEYIYVTAYLGSTKLGTDTAIINVKKERYEMKPSGITVSGRSGSQHEVKLYLEKTNGTNTIAPNSTTDYKVIWTTAGAYGKLNSAAIKSVTTITTYNNNAVLYECLDKDTKSATETIKARIYSKAKSAPESDYKIFDEVTGSVKIDNDPKKRILHVPVFLLHGDTSFLVGTQTGYNCAKIWAAQFHDDADAKSYQIQFQGAINAPNQTYSWLAGAATPAPPASYAGKSYANGVFTITWIGTGNYSLGWSPDHANCPPPSGEAQITITLK